MEVRSWSASDKGVAAHSSYCVVGSLLRFGGFNGQAEINTVAMRHEDGTWQQLATTGDLPSPRARAAAVSVDDTTMVVWGGAILVEGAPYSRFGPNTCADDGSLHVLDVPARHWRKITPTGWVPPPRQGHTATALRTSVVETSSSLAARFTARSQQTTKSRRTTVARCSCGVVDMMALRSGHSPRLPRAPTRSCPTPSTPEASSTSQQRRWLASGSSTCPVVLSTRCSASMVGKSRRSCFASTSVPPAEVARHRRGCSS